MFKVFKGGLLSVLSLTLAIVALYFVARINIDPKSTDEEIAIIAKVEGEIFSRLPKKKYIKLNPSQQPFSIYPDQRIYGSASSSIIISFLKNSLSKKTSHAGRNSNADNNYDLDSNYRNYENNPHLILSQGFEVSITQVKDKIFIHLLYGAIKGFNFNTDDDVFVIYNNQVFTASDPNLSLLAQQPSTSPALKNVYKTKNSTSKKKKSATGLLNSKIEKTLKTRRSYIAHIEQRIATKNNALENCQIKAIQSTKGAKGSLIIGFTVLNTGEIQNIRILSSNILNSSFEKCIIQVFARLQLDSFEGEHIYFSHSLKFQ